MNFLNQPGIINEEMFPGPFCNGIAVTVGKNPTSNHYQVNQCPNAKATKGDELKDAGCDLSHVETVHTDNTK